MKKIILYLSIILICASPIFAQAAPGGSGSGGTTPDPVTLTNPLTGSAGATDPSILIGNVINAVMGIVGSLALAMFIYGGLTWMLAAGNDQRVQKGKDILTWATIGLIVIFSGYALVRFVFVGLGFPQG